MEFLPIEIDGEHVYAGVGRRIAAYVLDGLLFMPLLALQLWMQRLTSVSAAVGLALFFVIAVAYRVAFPAMMGATPGKLVVDIRITKPNGDPIGWREALKRESVGIALGAILMLGALAALWNIAPSEYAALTSNAARSALRTANQAWWYPMALRAATAWMWTDSGALLFNTRRRALHDFIAGTIVVHVRFAEQSHRADGGR